MQFTADELFRLSGRQSVQQLMHVTLCPIQTALINQKLGRSSSREKNLSFLEIKLGTAIQTTVYDAVTGVFTVVRVLFVVSWVTTPCSLLGGCNKNISEKSVASTFEVNAL
jgi:hypothetical protein